MSLININKTNLSAGKFVQVNAEEALQLLKAYAAILNINFLTGPDRIAIWHDDMWFHTNNPNHVILYEYMKEIGFSGHHYIDADGADRYIIKYYRFELNPEYKVIKPASQIIQETSWEQLIRWKLSPPNQMHNSQPNNKSSTSKWFSWLTSEKLFGSMNAALWFALKTWRQLVKRPLNLIATVIGMSCVVAIVRAAAM